jgi:hypothetical protein
MNKNSNKKEIDWVSLTLEVQKARERKNKTKEKKQ